MYIKSWELSNVLFRPDSLDYGLLQQNTRYLSTSRANAEFRCGLLAGNTPAGYSWVLCKYSGMLWEKYFKIIKTKEDWNIQPASKHNIIIIIILALHGTVLNLFY